ncbi:EAL domain-containing protein [Halomonas sp. HAL1]|uniref:sensor domain-containing protein n=1 Tax=Halomonas sp. HAL1 TaxID=550984 RepID=UPI0002D5827A|nr:EAL domain-containing protein [Halomonas sp. HAL1]WKV92397.1 EAL domain-containing protein [Halomonas sp. HAL1]
MKIAALTRLKEGAKKKHSAHNVPLCLQARFHSLFTHHPDGIFELKPNNTIVHCNPASSLITGLSAEQLAGKNFVQLIHTDDRPVAAAAFNATLTGQQHQHYQAFTANSQDGKVQFEVTHVPIIADKQMIGVYAICRDITQHKQDESELRLLKRGIEASPNGVVMADATQPHLPLVYVNSAFTDITGYSAEEALGRNCRFLQGEDSDPMAIEEIRRAIVQQQDVQVLLCNYRFDGTLFWNQLSISPVFNNSGVCTHFIGIQQDITRQREQEARLAYQAAHDPLTGLPNLGALQARLERALQSCVQQGHKLALLHIDLDDFKPINEALGHGLGDELLKLVAQRLLDTATAGVNVARMSSDEFIVLLAPYQNEQEVIALTDHLLAALAQPFMLGRHRLHISASIGIASNKGSVTQAHDLLHHASLAMDDAKRQGRNTWQWYCGDTIDNVAEHVVIRRELQEAIQTGQLEAYYQPIVDAASGIIRSVETLIRWHHPTKGLVPPSVFIPIAEQTGQIIAIGRWVLERACHDIAALNVGRDQPLTVAVNISPVQFRRNGFLDGIKAALKASGLPPELLELEVTEGTLMTNTDQAIALLNEVRALGISVALDDFGTGFSSLSYLRDLPISKVKLDILFIRGISQNTKNAAIVQGVITMAHHLNLAVVAEGIETREEHMDLRQRQCDLLQGFLFSKPMPFEMLKRLPRTLTPP